MAEIGIVNLDDSIPASYWRLCLLDIKNGDGVATVTLKSGAVFHGKVSTEQSQDVALSLKSGHFKATFPHDVFETDGGWHVLDYTQIAAITGRLSR